jgi:hypothetical protein
VFLNCISWQCDHGPPICSVIANACKYYWLCTWQAIPLRSSFKPEEDIWFVVFIVGQGGQVLALNMQHESAALRWRWVRGNHAWHLHSSTALNFGTIPAFHAISLGELCIQIAFMLCQIRLNVIRMLLNSRNAVLNLPVQWVLTREVLGLYLGPKIGCLDFRGFPKYL